MIDKAALPPNPLDSALKALDITQDGIKALQKEVRTGALGPALDQAIDLIAANSTGRLIITGIGKSGHIARKLAATFSSTGTAAYFVHPTEASHGDLGMVSDSDVILALSWSGETAELASILAFATRFSVPLIAMTAGATSTLATAADVSLVLPKVREACPHNLAPTTSTVLQLALGDAIAMAVMSRKGFSSKDFYVFHPGGKLGSQLRRVSELMHKTNLPLLPVQSRMADAILAMTSGGFGVVGIVDADNVLQGVITDGDLRRFIKTDQGPRFEPEMLNAPVSQAMTRTPIVIAPHIFAAEALEKLQNRKISVLFVVEDGRPIGILHTLDLLRAGVA